jgi:hypothetical protein
MIRLLADDDPEAPLDVPAWLPGGVPGWPQLLFGLGGLSFSAPLAGSMA